MAKIITSDGQISSSAPVNIKTGNVSSSLYISGSNIGIGTTTPDSALDIEDGFISLSEILDTPPLPSPGKGALFVSSSDSKIYFRNDFGDIYDLTAGDNGGATGDITSVSAGTNLTGGGISGDVTLSLTSSITGGLTNISGVDTINATSITGSFSGDGSLLINISRKLINYINNGPAEEYTSSYLEITPADSVFPTSSIWYTDSTKTKKIYEEYYERYSGSATLINPNPITYKLYKEDGVTVLIEATDTLTYTQYGASALSRSISSSFY